MEKQFSSIFIPPCLREGELYGTRSQSVIAFWKCGEVEVRERTLDTDGHFRDQSVLFQLRPRDAARCDAPVEEDA